MMECYKCKTPEDLSPQKIDKHGNITFMCRSCRRESYMKHKAAHMTDDVRENSPENFPIKDWRQMAKKRNSKLSLQYRDRAFMEAKGLICA